jgi:uncharacterized membrane protein
MTESFSGQVHERAFALGQDACGPVGCPTRQNVGQYERWASIGTGAALAAFGLSRGRAPGLLLAIAGGALVYRGLTGHCDLYQALGMSTVEPNSDRASIAQGQGVKVEASLTINRPRSELFQYWRNFENLPRFMHHLHSVRVTGPNRSHWSVGGLLGAPIEWDAEIINERPNELIAWRSTDGSLVSTAGSVHFSDASVGPGTQIDVDLRYDAPGGAASAAVAGFFGRAPEQLIREDLQRFKTLMEQRSATVSGHASTPAPHPHSAPG